MNGIYKSVVSLNYKLYRENVIGSDANACGRKCGVAKPQRSSVHEPHANVGQHSHRHHNKPSQKNVCGLCETKNKLINKLSQYYVLGHYLPGCRCRRIRQHPYQSC